MIGAHVMTNRKTPRKMPGTIPKGKAALIFKKV
jgi:hypothetical protein